MTVFDTLRSAVRPAPVADDADVPAVRPVLGRGPVSVLALIGLVLLGSTLALLFGPARGMRDDIGEVQTDLASSEQGIYGTLGTQRESLSAIRGQLVAVERSLVLQQQGLEVAQAAEQDTTAIREQTEAALAAVREVTRAVGGAEQLGRDLAAAVRLAEAALQVAEQTLRTGQATLAVAREQLATLQRSREVQEELLRVARETLEQTREINRKTPGVPVLPEQR